MAKRVLRSYAKPKRHWNQVERRNARRLGGPCALTLCSPHRDTICTESSDGFSVEVLGRTGLRYREGDRQMFVDSEALTGPSGMADG